MFYSNNIPAHEAAKHFHFDVPQIPNSLNYIISNETRTFKILFRRMVDSFIWLVSLPLSTTATAAIPQPLYAAFYYGIDPPLEELHRFNVVVVEPAHIHDAPRTLPSRRKLKQELFAYVSLGEVHTSRPYYADIPPKIMRAENSTWGSMSMDQSSPVWREFFLSQIIAPLWEQGWRGFFIDTVDAYQLFAKTDDERLKQRQGLIETIKKLSRRYPKVKLIFNRGFELLPELAPVIYAMAAESLYRRYDASRKQYRPVPAEDRDWLLGQMKATQARYGLPIISIDYVDPADPKACQLVRDTTAKIRAEGLIPWITDGALASLMQIHCQIL